MKTTTTLLSRLTGGVPLFVALFLFFGLFGYPPIVIAADATLAELMEQGVYSEETKGDLDAAMQFYQQVVTKADVGQALAAQALFRLASCQDKKKDFAAATATFEKLVRDYPNQKELVALANDYLADGVTLLPAPWVDSEELTFNVNLPSGFKIGVARFAVADKVLDGRKICQLNAHLFAGGMQQWSRIEVDASSFKPIHCRWKHVLLGDSETVYTPGHAAVKIKGKDDVKNVDLAGAVYDNEEALQLMRRLPLAAGYSKKLSLFVGLTGGNILPLKLDVTGPEKVQVPAGTFDCFKVELNIKQTFWFSADAHRYLVKFEAGGVMAELTAVKQNSSPAPERYDDPTRGFSLTLPTGWIIDRKAGADEAKLTELVLLDPEANALTMVKVEALENFDEPARASVRAFAEHQIIQGKKYSKEFNVRPDSWTETTVAGNPAVSFVADVVVQGDIRRVARGVYSFVAGKTVDIIYFATQENFDAFRPQFDTVVASYQGK